MKIRTFTKFPFVFLFVGYFLLSFSTAFSQAPTYTLTPKIDACDGLDNGSFTITVTSRARATQYSILRLSDFTIIASNVPIGLNVPTLIPNLQADDYLIGVGYIVAPAQTVSSGVTIGVISPDLLASINTAVNNTSCTVPNGSVSINVSGGSGMGYSYSWTAVPPGFTASTQNISGLVAANYQVIVSDNGSNCTRTLNQVVTDPSPTPFVLSTSTPIVCEGLTGIINLSNSEVPPPLPGVSYDLRKDGVSIATTAGTGSALAIIVPASELVAPNTYVFTMVATNGLCTPVTMTGSPAITVDKLPTITNVSNTNVSCNGGANGTITVVASGGTGALTYTLNPGAISNATGVFTGLVAATYTVTVTDVNSCGPTTSNIVVTQPTVITFSSTISSNVTCNGLTDGSISVTATGGTGTLTYTLNPGAISNTTGSFPGLAGNTYTVSVTDANSCGPVVTPNILIVNPAVISISSTASANVSCNGGSNGSITVVGAGGTGTLTYTLSPGAVSNTTGIFAGLPANTYTVSITDANSCPAAVTPNIVITQPPIIIINSSVSTNVTTCAGGSNGSITVSASGGTGTITYTLNPGGISNTTGLFPGLTANTYTVSVTDANSCGPIVTPNIVITEPLPIVISSSSSTNASCNGGTNGTITVAATGGTGALTYTLNPGAISNTTGLFTNLAANTYTVSITDVNGCGPVVTPNITISNPPAISITSTASTNVSCNGGSNGTVTVVASGGTGTLTYTLNPGAISNTTGIFGGLAANTYTVSITDVNACGPVVTPNIAVTQPTAISITSSSSTNVTTCAGGNNGTITVAATGGTGALTYTLNPGAISNATGIFVGLTASTYTVSITDVNSCGPIVTPNIVITQPPAISITSTSSTNILCNGGTNGTITVAATGGTGALTYTLNPGAISNATGLFTNLAANTYTVSITDVNGCGPVVTPNIIISNPPAISITSTASTNVSCNGGSNGTVTVVASGGTGTLTYTLNPGAISNTTGIFGGLAANTYTVSITDVNACGPVVTPNIAVTQPTAISITSSSSTNVTTCAGGNNGTITVAATGGTGALTYTLNPGAISNATGIFVGLTASTYTVSITDVNSCGPIVTPNIVITQPPAISITSTSSTNILCNGGTNGTITVAATGGTGALTYTLNPGAISNATGLFTNLAANTYTVSITDVNGCGPVVTPNINITDPPAISITSSASTNVNCNGGSTGTVTVVASGGTGTLTYTLNPGAISNTTGLFTGLTANTYTVSITDVNACGPVVTPNIAVTQPTAISITSSASTDATCNGVADGTITIAATGGTGTLTYTLNPGAISNTTGIFTALSANTYTVSITDANACGPVVTPNIAIIAPAAISITSSTKTDATCNSVADGTITIAATGGTGALTYTLNPGGISNATGAFTGLAAATYTVSITDVNGCGPVVTPNIVISQPTAISITSSTKTDATCNGVADGKITVVATGGTGALTYTLNPGAISNATGAFTGLVAATYTVSITDANGCGPVVTPNIVISEPAAITITSSTSTNATCNGVSNGTITVAAAGGTGSLTYTLNPGAISNATGIFTNLAVNTYTVSITDASGCGPVVTPNIAITEPAAISITSTASTDASCNGVADGSITIVATGGTGALTYTLNPGGISNATGIFTGLAAATYTVSITDANSCGPVVTPNIAISQPTAISITSTASTDATCNGVADGSITVVATGGTGALTYTLNPGGISNATGIFTGLIAGSYTVSITDASGCGPVVTPNIIISEPAAITITSTVSANATCNGVADGTITMVAAGGTGALTYTLNPGAISNGTGIFTGLAAATYTVSITDANGCGPTVSPNIVISEPTAITITSTASTDATCNAGSDGSVTVAATGGTGTLTYTISPGAISNSTGIFPGLAANTYTVSITDANACGPIVTANIVVSEPTAITITSSTHTNVTCFGGTDGTITVAATGGTGTLIYTLNPGAISNTTGSFTGLIAGSYTVSITDDNSCGPVVSPAINVTEPPQVTATISTPTPTICNGSPGSLKIDFGGAPISTSWTFVYSDGTTSSPAIPNFFTSITFPINPTTTTTYNLVSVIDNHSCVGVVSGTPTITVNNPPDKTLAVGASINPLCFGGSTNITVANSENGVSYQLRDASNTAIGAPVVGTGGTISLPSGVLAANTTFNVLATVPACTAAQLNNTVSVTVGGSVNAGLTVTALADPICAGSTATVRVIASETGVLYQLRNDFDDSLIGGTVAGTGGDIDLPAGVLAATTTFNVLANNGTCSIELTQLKTITVDTNPDPSLPVSVILDPVCVGGSSGIQVDNTENGVSYQLRDAGNVNVGAAVAGNGSTIVLATGPLAVTTTFNILATGGASCTPAQLTTLATVTVNGVIDASKAVSAVDNPICINTGTFIRITGSDVGVDYQLRDDNGDVNFGLPVSGTGGDIDLPTGNLSDTTTFNILASNGTCSIELTAMATVNVQIDPNPSLAVAATIDPLCVGGISSISIQNSEAGVTYQLRDDFDDSLIGSAVAGTGGTISLSTGPLAVTTTFNVLASSGTACASVELTTTPTVTVGGSIDASLTTIASPTSICANSSAFVQIANSELNVDYQLRLDSDDSLVGSLVVGTGGTINIPTGNLASTTIFNVLASNGTCSIELTDTVKVNVNPSANPALVVTASPNPICSGTASTITVQASEVGVTYELRIIAGNTLVSTIAGTGANISFSTGGLLANTSYKIMAIRGTCTVQLSTTVPIVVRPVGDPACTIVTPPGCASLTQYDIIPTLTSCSDPDHGALEFQLPSNYDVILEKLNDGSFAKQTKRNDTLTFNLLKAGDYIFTIRDLAGNVCVQKDTFTLEKFTQVKIDSAFGIQNAVCFGDPGNVKLAVEGTTTGKYFFSYTNNGIESAAQEFTPGAILPGGLPANDTDFIIIKVDETISLSCPDTVMVAIRNQNPKLGATYAITPTTCDANIGAITAVQGTGGTGSGYTFILDGTKTEPFDNLAGGNHILTISDGVCTVTDTIFIPFPGQVVYNVTHTNASCSGHGNDATIRVDFTNPDTYVVGLSDDPQIEPETYLPVLAGNMFFTFNNLSRGSYYVFVKGSASTCPTVSSAEIVGGIAAIDFGFESVCQDSVVSVKLINIKYENDTNIAGGLVLTVLDNTNFAVVNQVDVNFPINNEIYLSATDAALSGFFNRTGEYTVILGQLQDICFVESDPHAYTILPRLTRPDIATKASFSKLFQGDVGTGEIVLSNFTGGLAPYNVDIASGDFESNDDVPLFGDRSLTYSQLFPGVYRVNLTDSLGCSLPEFKIIVEEDKSLLIPNIFTPNGDGVNDDFMMRNVPENSKIVICDRWGKEVFKSNDYGGHWWTGDGVSDGIYYYNIRIDKEAKSGWVEVLRAEKP